MSACRLAGYQKVQLRVSRSTTRVEPVGDATRLRALHVPTSDREHMFRRRRQRPITSSRTCRSRPMLDMSFQLLAFFIMTFKPAPTEGQIAMTLPEEEGGATVAGFPTPSDDKPSRYIVRVEATDNGTIKKMTLRGRRTANEPKDLGVDAERVLRRTQEAVSNRTRESRRPSSHWRSSRNCFRSTSSRCSTTASGPGSPTSPPFRSTPRSDETDRTR